MASIGFGPKFSTIFSPGVGGGVTEGWASVTSACGDTGRGVVFFGINFPDWTWPIGGLVCLRRAKGGVAVDVVFMAVVVIGSTLAAYT